MYSCEYNNTSYHTVDVNCWVGVVETGVHGTCRRSTSARSIIRSIQYSYDTVVIHQVFLKDHTAPPPERTLSSRPVRLRRNSSSATSYVCAAKTFAVTLSLSPTPPPSLRLPLLLLSSPPPPPSPPSQQRALAPSTQSPTPGPQPA